MNDEQQKANNILQQIIKLPGAILLLEYTKAGHTYPDKLYDYLFNWLLTGKYTPGIITKLTTPDMDLIENIIRHVIAISKNTQLTNQILQKIANGSKDEQTVRNAQIIDTLNELGEKYDLNLVQLLGTFQGAWFASKVLLTGEYKYPTQLDYIIEFIINPNKISLKDDINSYVKNDLSGDLTDSLVEYLAENNSEISTDELRAMTIEQLLELFNESTKYKNSEAIQKILSFLHPAPVAPEVPTVFKTYG